jgi:hypothetical protein
LTGCLGNQTDGNDGSGDTPSSDGTDTNGGTETTGESNGESSQESVIPGEVVHNELEGVEVLNHWVTSDDIVKLRIQNSGDNELNAPAGFSGGDPVIQGRKLSQEGNSLGEGRWQTGAPAGPETVSAESEATIGFLINAGASNAARYELCITTSPVGGLSMASWGDLCGESTEG